MRDIKGIDINTYSIEKANDLIRSLGLSDRAHAQAQNITEIIEVDHYDLVLFIGSLHEIDTSSQKMAIQKAYQSLKLGGTLIISDYEFPGSKQDYRTEKYLEPIMVSWYELIWSGKVLSYSEIKCHLENAGFQKFSTQHFMNKYYIVTATK